MTAAFGRTTAHILIEIGAVHFRPQDPFILTSGRASPVYIDCRKVISFPRARRKIVEMMGETVEAMIGFESLDAVAGGETAGIPYAAWLAERVVRIHPGVHVLFMSGYAPDQAPTAEEIGRTVDFLEKPATPEEILRKVREVLDRPR